MIKAALRRWLANRRERRRHRGYLWAQACLARGEITVAEIEAQLECTADFNEWDTFDDGISAAVEEAKTKAGELIPPA